MAGAILFALFAFLALYTWNARTGYLDTLAEHSGLEVTGYLLLPGTWVKTEVSRQWNTYVSLIGVAEENARLREEASERERYIASVREDLAELARLRAFFGMTAPEGWEPLGARVIAGRFGPGASLETVMIDRGFASGGAVGTPLVTHQGLVGRVFRAAPHIATVLLITDQTFRVPVLTSEGRVPGVLVGGGPSARLEVRYMAPNVTVAVGETLVTSGVEDSFPKGIPVARVVSVEPGTQTLFQQIHAEPLAAPDALEEALLLIPPRNWPVRAGAPDRLPESMGPFPRQSPQPGPQQAQRPQENAETAPANETPAAPRQARTTPSRATQ